MSLQIEQCQTATTEFDTGQVVVVPGATGRHRYQFHTANRAAFVWVCRTKVRVHRAGVFLHGIIGLAAGSLLALILIVVMSVIMRALERTPQQRTRTGRKDEYKDRKSTRLNS